MNAPSNTLPSKGMMMIAAYRAERLSQRPALRTCLHQSHVARRAARHGGQTGLEPGEVTPPETTLPLPNAVEQEMINSVSVFASLVSTSVADQQNEAARIQAVQAETDAWARTRTSEPLSAEVECVGIQPAEAQNDGSHGAQQSMTAPPAAKCRPDQPEPEVPATQALLDAPIPPAPVAVYDPPLAEIGFGPGMLIRLSQLGLHTTLDLAKADAVELRSALGDISRLVDVDAWIRSAQQTTRTAPTNQQLHPVLAEVEN